MNKAPLHGRGASANPPNRFEKLWIDPSLDGENDPSPPTQYFKDPSRSIISTNASPDVGFNTSINPYRGCEHGCTYCYARPGHEFLNLSAGLDFESKILIKQNAPGLLRRALASSRWTPQVLAMCGVTDPYQPVERTLGLTRKCLEVLAEFRNPVVIVTKSALVTRDADILGDLATDNAAAVFLSITTLDSDLARRMEPRASQPWLRLRAIETLRRAGVPTGVMVAPVIPGLTDHEIPAIISAAARAGAGAAGKVILRLPYGVKNLFEQWLTQHYPNKKQKVMNRIRALRNGKLNDPDFRSRMTGEGAFADQMASLFSLACRKAGVLHRFPALSTASFRSPEGGQLKLIDD